MRKSAIEKFRALALGAAVLFLVGAAMSLLLRAAVSAQVKWKGTIVKEGDVTVVKNPKEPLTKTPVLELEEELSLGGAEAEDKYGGCSLRSGPVRTRWRGSFSYPRRGP